MGDNSTNLIIMVIVSFALAFVLILKKDTIPDRLRRPMAIFALIAVSLSAILMIVALFQMGS